MRHEVRAVLEDALSEGFARAITELSEQREDRRLPSLHHFQFRSDRRGHRGFIIDIYLRKGSVFEGPTEASNATPLPEPDYTLELGQGLPYWVMDYLFDVDRRHQRDFQQHFNRFLNTEWSKACEDYQFRARERLILSRIQSAREIDASPQILAELQHALMMERERMADHFNSRHGGSRTGRWGGGRGNPYTSRGDAYVHQLQSRNADELRGLYEGQQWTIDEEVVISRGMAATELMERQREMARRMSERAEARFRELWNGYAGGVWTWDLAGDADPEAAERGLKLLRENLSPSQLAEYDAHKWFTVIGGDSGRTYRIKQGRQQNVYEIRHGKVISGWCFLTEGSLVEGDVMLAQKIGLELQEQHVLGIANPFTIYGNEFADLRGPERSDPVYRGGLDNIFVNVITS